MPKHTALIPNSMKYVPVMSKPEAIQRGHCHREIDPVPRADRRDGSVHRRCLLMACMAASHAVAVKAMPRTLATSRVGFAA